MTKLIEQLNNADSNEVALGSLAVLNSIQNLHPTIQIASLITMTGLLMEVFGLDVRAELTRLERLVANAESNGWDKKFAAVRAYIEGELGKHLNG
jgi:hypothetical protein